MSSQKADGPADDDQQGDAPTLAVKKLREASADLLIKREEYGRDTATTLLGQAATVITFLGAFSLLDDAGKAAVVQSDFSRYALAATALSMAFALSTHFLLPSRMPSLDNHTELRAFWNKRAGTRKALLALALIALGVAVFFALKAYGEARNAVEKRPAASISSELSQPSEGLPSLKITVTWSSLERGARTLTCVRATTDGSAGSDVAAGLGTAGKDGDLTSTLSLSVPTVTDELTATTTELTKAPTTEETENAMSACAKAATAGTRPAATATVSLTH